MNLVELLRLYSKNIEFLSKLNPLQLRLYSRELSLLQRVETPYWLSADKLEKKKPKVLMKRENK